MAGRWQREMPERAGHYWTRTGDGEVAGIVEVCALRSGGLTLGLFSPAYLRRDEDGGIAPGSTWGGWWWSAPVSPIPSFESAKLANTLGASSVEKLSKRDRARAAAGQAPADVTPEKKLGLCASGPNVGHPHVYDDGRGRCLRCDEEPPVQYRVYRQEWIESERGWGVRPDGSTVHLTLDDRNAFIAGYNRTFNNQASAPDCYTRAEGDARQVSVSMEVYEKLMTHREQGSDWKRFGAWE